MQGAARPGSGGGSRACGQAGRGRGQRPGCAVARDRLCSTQHTCCCRRAAMSRVVWLLLGAALLCGHGAFCRRVVSGESGATRPPSGRAGGRLGGARGAGGGGRPCEAACPGAEALPGTGNLCRAEAGKWIVCCLLLCPPKHTYKSLNFLEVLDSTAVKRALRQPKQHSVFQE